MIPSTLVGLVLFAASLGPGYFYVRETERRVARAERSQLLEAVELVVIGSLVTTIVSMLVLTGTRAISLVDTSVLRREGAAYLLLHPLRGLSVLTAIFALSYGAAWAAAWAVHFRDWRSQRPGSVWRHVLGRDKKTHIAIATVELRDGRMVQGQIESYTLDPSAEPRELALRKPIRERLPGSTQEKIIDDDFLILGEQDLLYVATAFRRRQPAPEGQRRPRFPLLGQRP